MTHTQTTYTNRIALRAGKKGARPAEVGALASVFEKSATELKQSKLLKCKQTLQIATFNVRTFRIIYFVLTYVYVSSLLLLSENMCGTRPNE